MFQNHWWIGLTALPSSQTLFRARDPGKGYREESRRDGMDRRMICSSEKGIGGNRKRKLIWA